MKISIITATFNSAATVKDTFDSVLAQTHKDIEYIVVDGLSKDNTLDIIKEYEPKFEGKMRWISEKDKGLYDAMNKGIAMATGDVVGILNSDDFYINNDVVESISNTIEQEKVDCVYGNLHFVDAKDTNKIVRTWKGSQHTAGAFKKGWHPAHPTFYAKLEHFRNFGAFDITFDVSADFELMLRFIEKHKLKNKYIDKFFVKMRVGGESTGSISKIIKGNKNIIRAFRKNGIKVSVFYPVKRLVPKAINMIKSKIKR
jgi:glycosyltransferase involved in cell wall biosynthesis